MNQSAIEKEYREKALNYRRIFDSSLGFARPKMADGSFKPEFDVLDTHGQGFIEGNTWNYSFFVPHDVNGLIHQMGGEQAFVRRLDSLFTMHLPAHYFENTEDINEEGLMGNYVHGNEPSHHIPYLYRWTNEPWKAEARLHKIMRQMYKNKVDGLSGNDDCGQMSAWYIFSALGFYPVCPGSTQYVIGSPLGKSAVIQLENGKTFEVVTKNYSPKHVYIKQMKLNGKPYRKSYITHADIMAGGKLEFEMSSRPNKQSATYEKPYSLTHN